MHLGNLIQDRGKWPGLEDRNKHSISTDRTEFLDYET